MYRILILNDHPVMLKALRYLLEPEGYGVTCVADSRTALSVLRNEPVDLFIQDILRPEINGFALYWLMKSDEELQNIPIIIVTNLSAVETTALEDPNKGTGHLYSVKFGVSSEHLAAVSDIENANVLQVQGYLHSTAAHQLVETARAILAKSEGAGQMQRPPNNGCT